MYNILMQLTTHKHKVLIVGGGFGGVKAAQILGRDPKFSVQMIDPKSFMEYHAAVYRLATGRSPGEVCVPYSALLKGTSVEHCRATIVDIDQSKKRVTDSSGGVYSYDTLILATGCEAAFFGIVGIEEHAFGIDGVQNALKLKRHIHDAFEHAKNASDKSEQVKALHIVVVGGGASGVELAGEFASYTKALARQHGVDPSLVTVDLIEAMPRVLPGLPESLSKAAEGRLRSLGVNMYLNRSVIREESDSLFLKDMEITTKTVVWTAGLKANRLATTIKGATLDKRGRCMVDGYLRMQGVNDIYAIGDTASTTHSGMAQTALSDARYVCSHLQAILKGKEPKLYTQSAPAYAVPVGPLYAVVLYHGIRATGFLGWVLRRAADLRAFLNLMPLQHAITAFLAGSQKVESCDICTKYSR